MPKPFRDRVKKRMFATFIFIILIYGSYRLYDYISGPKIRIDYPLPYQIISEDTVIIKGNIKNSKTIYLNGREINIDENGNFAEEVIIKAPYTTIAIEAIDKYGKQKVEILELGKS